MDEKIKKKHEKAGFLRKEEKILFLQAVREGILPTQAAKYLGRTYATVCNTEEVDPEFARLFDEARSKGLAQKCEESLLTLANGEAYTEKIKYVPVYKDGVMQLDENGDPIMKIISHEKTKLPPDKGAGLAYLKATRPNMYGDHKDSATMGDEPDQEEIWTALSEKYNQPDEIAP